MDRPGSDTRSPGVESSVMRLLGELRADTSVERLAFPGTQPFYRRFWETSTPVVLVGFQADWPASRGWSLPWFRQHHGETEVALTVDRDSDPDHDIHFRRHTRTMKLGEYIDTIEGGAPGNDVYMIANNGNMDRPELRALLSDLRPPGDLLDASPERGHGSLWLGPAGTRTPLHHDQSNILLCQIVGHKRVHLASPWTPALWARARGLYSRLDPTAEPGVFLAAGGATVDLHAGDCLFIPVGWWHEVRAVTPSISVGLTGFTRPNTFDWLELGRQGKP